VRLKDVIELLSKFGLGASSHHIISQGEADRILIASSKERREMLEDALGLKIYQLKRQEAERKLKKTKENISQVESLQKEIQPHLKFLKKQAEKVEKTLTLREKLRDLCREYFAKEENFLSKEFKRLNDSRDKPLKELRLAEEKIKKFRSELEKCEKAVLVSSEVLRLETDLENMRSRRLSLERDLGRIEGMIEFQETMRKEAEKEMIERSAVEKFIERLNRYFKEGFLKTTFEKIQKTVADFSSEIKFQKQTAIFSELEGLRKKYNDLSVSVENIKRDEKSLADKIFQCKSETEKKEHFRRDAERELYNAELSVSNLKNHLKSFELEEEKWKARKEELEAEKQSVVHFLGGEISLPDKKDVFGELTFAEREQIRREIERLKIKLEDSEGIGDDVLREYHQVKTRDDFFEKELGDLKKAAGSLIDLMKELAEKIDHDFQKGVLDINNEFKNFFATMFCGGTAELKVTRNQKHKKEEEEFSFAEASEDEEEGLPSVAEQGEAEEGIEISVNIPRKRIRSLDMLSGGERALTSIALLFAMTNVNPPPFLVLDEVDAALDESNSQKYAKILKDLSLRTQLIIVTHNRETMKQAGLLYGVTIGSSGVSQILSIKFEEAEELAAQDK
jgi:chromosome segregation protein